MYESYNKGIDLSTHFNYLCDMLIFHSKKSNAKNEKIKANEKEISECRKKLCEEIVYVGCLLIQHRHNSNIQMNLAMLKDMFTKSLKFLQPMESLASLTFYEIRGILLSQAQAFLGRFHTSNTKMLKDTLKNDKWMPVPVPLYLQLIAEYIQTYPKNNQLINKIDNEKKNYHSNDG